MCHLVKNKEARDLRGPEYQRDYLRNRRREQKKKILEYYNSKCYQCGLVDEPCVYDLHHIDPTEKEFGIAQYLDRKWERILPELEKCIMLCSNCHRKLHFSYKE